MTSSTVKLLALGAAAEAATGVILAMFPAPFIRLLLGADLSGPGMALGRLAGFALIALGVACWPRKEGTAGGAAPLAMVIYGFLAAVYLLVLGLDGALVGVLLWPATAAHAALTLVLAQAWLSRQA